MSIMDFCIKPERLGTLLNSESFIRCGTIHKVGAQLFECVRNTLRHIDLAQYTTDITLYSVNTTNMHTFITSSERATSKTCLWHDQAKSNIYNRFLHQVGWLSASFTAQSQLHQNRHFIAPLLGDGWMRVWNVLTLGPHILAKWSLKYMSVTIQLEILVKIYITLNDIGKPWMALKYS